MIIIDAGYFYAGLELGTTGKVVRAAPIIRYMTGWSADRVRRYARLRGWKVMES